MGDNINKNQSTLLQDSTTRPVSCFRLALVTIARTFQSNGTNINAYFALNKKTS